MALISPLIENCSNLSSSFLERISISLELIFLDFVIQLVQEFE